MSGARACRDAGAAEKVARTGQRANGKRRKFWVASQLRPCKISLVSRFAVWWVASNPKISLSCLTYIEVGPERGVIGRQFRPCSLRFLLSVESNILPRKLDFKIQPKNQPKKEKKGEDRRGGL